MILVIGGSGFVGSILINELRDLKINNLDKNQSPFYNDLTQIGDITNKEEIIIPKGTKSIVLLAAEHRDDVSPISLI
jgi:nucleoside-diphosphate-sugar epimerase